MKRWILAACAALVAMAGEARADDTGTRRLTIELDWKHVTRGDGVESKQRADIPGGALYYYRFTNGRRAFSLEFADGLVCATSASKDMLIHLQCGKTLALYELFQEPRRQAQLEWVTSGAARGQSPPGTTSDEAPVDKPKVRL